MRCEHLGNCASCFYFEKSYQDQLEKKLAAVQETLEPFYKGKIAVYKSPQSHFRARAEFRVFKQDGTLSYAMHDFDKRLLPISQCPKVIGAIEDVAFVMLQKIEAVEQLRHKLYAVEFLSGLSGEVLVTLIYHKRLDEQWQECARQLQECLDIKIVGRSKKQKVVLDRDYIVEKLQINAQELAYYHYEASFTQPNPKVNEKMIEWAIEHAKKEGDLLEAYCGGGNFTIALAKYYDRVLATEISKRSIAAAKQSCAANGVKNIDFIRLSSAELTQALQKQREFNRLRGVDLDSFGFTTVLVDPPRAGLDHETLQLIAGFEQIIYISCNPQTLARDLEQLCKTHTVQHLAVFDQFAYSNHIESGVILQRRADAL